MLCRSMTSWKATMSGITSSRETSIDSSALFECGITDLAPFCLLMRCWSTIQPRYIHLASVRIYLDHDLCHVRMHWGMQLTFHHRKRFTQQAIFADLSTVEYREGAALLFTCIPTSTLWCYGSLPLAKENDRFDCLSRLDYRLLIGGY